MEAVWVGSHDGGTAAVRGARGGDQWKYSFCPRDPGKYWLVLSNLAFVHISFLDYFLSNDPIMVKFRDKTDEVFNCDDLAINYVVSMLTCNGPLRVVGREPYVSYLPKIGTSTSPKHKEIRHGCLNYFNDLFGYMPLVRQTGRIEQLGPAT